MALAFIRAEIERTRLQIRRSKKRYCLFDAGISTASAELLTRMQATVDGLCDKLDKLKAFEISSDG